MLLAVVPPRKREAHAALVVSEEEAQVELKAARAKVSQLATYLSSATPGDMELRAQLCGREVGEMPSAHQAHMPRADLHGEVTVA